jgi:hypothetical protein
LRSKQLQEFIFMNISMDIKRVALVVNLGLIMVGAIWLAGGRAARRPDLPAGEPPVVRAISSPTIRLPSKATVPMGEGHPGAPTSTETSGARPDPQAATREPEPASDPISAGCMDAQGVSGSREPPPIQPDAPAGPVILSDFHSWTVIGPTAVTIADDRVRFSQGLGIADRHGTWITAEQGDLLLADGKLVGVAAPGPAAVRVRPETSMADFMKSLELLRKGQTAEVGLRVSP